ncbi:MAG: hypothetical protein AAFO69_11115, partial [Bacteroidota bacterium]
NEIHLPSGSKMYIDYEMDDYAYVQHKQAMKMVPITTTDITQWHLSFDKGAYEFSDYLDALNGEDLYYRALVNMRLRGRDVEQEYVSGYLPVQNATYTSLRLGGSGTIPPLRKQAFQFMRVNAPKLTTDYSLSFNEDVKVDFFPAVQLLASLVRETEIIFKGFDNYAKGQGWAASLDSDKAWVRVPVLSGYKYGGGHRVKRIRIKESDAPGAAVYGQIYDYTTVENGQAISSGVAQNEPMVGAEESPFRKAKKYTKSIPLSSNNNLFFEYPINEGSFPGASVGYSKVTVMSLATAKKSENDPFNDISYDDVDYGTTGKMVYEFYTARDFPTIVAESEKQPLSYRDISIASFLGINSSSYYTATQGYSIVNNDMHGKPKKNSQFRLKEDGVFEEEPYAYTTSQYRSKTIVYDGTEVQMLLNDFYRDQQNENMLRTEGTNTNEELLVGVEQEVVLDMRRHRDEAYRGGLNANIDMIQLIFPFTVPSQWPNVSRTITESKTAVSNKIVYTSGILQSTESMQDGAVVKTEYLGWDALTGRPVLTKIVNEYSDKPTFSYVVPAYTQYPQMGGAYANNGFRYRLSNVVKITDKNEYEAWVDDRLISGDDPTLVPGDEVVLREIVEDPEDLANNQYLTVGAAIYLGTFSGAPRYHFTGTLSNEKVYEAIIYRSGKRNHLGVDAGSITGLDNPLDNETPPMTIGISKDVVIPAANQ